MALEDKAAPEQQVLAGFPHAEPPLPAAPREPLRGPARAAPVPTLSWSRAPRIAAAPGAVPSSAPAEPSQLLQERREETGEELSGITALYLV